MAEKSRALKVHGKSSKRKFVERQNQFEDSAKQKGAPFQRRQTFPSFAGVVSVGGGSRVPLSKSENHEILLAKIGFETAVNGASEGVKYLRLNRPASLGLAPRAKEFGKDLRTSDKLVLERLTNAGQRIDTSSRLAPHIFSVR